MRYSLCLALLVLTSCSGSPQPAVTELPQKPLAAWRPSLHLAETSLAAGAPAIALQVTEELVARDPSNVAAQDRRGDALVALGRRHEAEAAYGAALAVKPHDPEALIGMGRLRLSEDPAEAERLFTEAAARDPRSEAALNNLGVARDLQGHHTAAQEAYRQALAVRPTSASVQVNLGLSLALSGDPAGGVRLLRPLAKEPNTTPRVRGDFALALALDGNGSEASATLAQDLGPEQVRMAVSGFQALRP